MTDEDLIAQSGSAPTMYFDGFGAFRKMNGLFRCIGFVLESGPQLNLVISLAGADIATTESRRVLDEKATKGLAIWNGTNLAH